MTKMSKSVQFSEFLSRADRLCADLERERRENEKYRRLQEFRERPTAEIVNEMIKAVEM